MTTVPHETPGVAQARRPSLQVGTPEMWAGLAIITMWIAVLFAALFGPDMVFTDGGGSSTIPSVVPIAGCAFLATWILARFAFRFDRKPE